MPTRHFMDMTRRQRTKPLTHGRQLRLRKRRLKKKRSWRRKSEKKKKQKEKANRLAIQRIKEQKENEELEKVRLDAERQALAAAGKSAADMTPTELTAFKVARGAAKKELGKMQRFFARPKQASGLGSQGIGGIGGGASGPTVVTIPSLSIPDEPQGVKMTKTATGDFVFVFPVSGLGNSSITVEISDINGIMTVDSVSSK